MNLQSTYFGVTSDSAKMLFGSLGSQSKGNVSSNMFGSMYNTLSDYSNIRSGSYKTALDAYFNPKEEDAASKRDATIKSFKNKDMPNYVKEELAADLSSSATTSKSSLSKISSTKTEDTSNASSSKESEAMKKAVSTFIDDYNSLIKSANESLNDNEKGSTRLINELSTVSKSFAKTLDNIGITTNKDGTLSIDTDTFEKADTNKLKSIFDTTTKNTFGSEMNKALTKIQLNASQYINSEPTYSSSKNAYSSSITGTLFDFGF